MPDQSSISSGPTPGQCELLGFFGRPIPSTKRQASLAITELLADPSNQRRWTVERARRYVSSMEPAISGSGGHTATFNCVRSLLHGFGLSIEEARPLLGDFNHRCQPPWSESELEHKLRSVDGLTSQFARGYLVGDLPAHPSAAARTAAGVMPEREVRKKVEFDPKKLAEIAAPWRNTATLTWLANRSAVDPASLSHIDFLKLIYPHGEKILIFTDYFSQGQFLWPDESPANTGPLGVWYLPAPVDGKIYPNPRSQDKDGKARMSRRSEESVVSYPYMLLESDKADMRDWLGFIVQAPLQIEAIYTSGGRSIHALVRVDCRTKAEWDDEKKGMMPFLMGCVMVGGDRGVLSAVRLSRLPGCFREGQEDEQKRYMRFPRPKAQKLLYVRPAADDRPLCELPLLRDVESAWCERGRKAIDGYDDVDQVRRGLEYYANVSESCRRSLADLEGAA